MIMEGLETLVAPSHHAFLLTESAAAAHFNVLSFDTCLFKTTAQTSPSTAPVSASSAATYLSAPSSFGSGHLGAQTLLHYSLSTNNNNNNSNHSNSNSNSSTSHHQHHHQQHNSVTNVSSESTLSIISPSRSVGNSVSGRNSSGPQTTTTARTTVSSVTPTATSGRNSASHLSLLNTHHSPSGSSNDTSSVGKNHHHSSHQNNSNNPHESCDTQTGDLNTPVTTSSDIPSFFGPSTVVEPPPITGKNFSQLKFKHINVKSEVEFG